MTNDEFIATLPKPILWIGKFTRFAFSQFFLQNGPQIASSLAYATLLSLVPLITVMFGFLGGLPVFKDLTGEIQQFIFTNFVPSFSDSIQNYLLEFSNKASRLTFTGSVVLLFIALMLMATIDNAFNRIWNIKHKRSPVARFLVYWALLTLGPLFIGTGLVTTSYLLSLPVLDDVYTSFGLEAKVLRIMPFLTTSIAFSILYMLVPNCFVAKKHALVSGVIAAFLFELAKYGFGIYVKTIPTYEAIYGAIAVIPIFLLWIYLSWVIILLGAHICYCLANFHLDDDGRQYGRENWDFIDVYKIIAILWEAQREGGSLSMAQIQNAGIDLSQERIIEVLYILCKEKWANRSAAGNYVLTRDLSEVKVADLYDLMPFKLVNDITLKRLDRYEQSIEPLMNECMNNTHDLLDIPIRDLLIKIEH